MKPNDQPTDDLQLRSLLRASRPDVGLPLGFQAAVWRQIARRAATSPVFWLERLMSFVLRPQWAAVSLAVVMLAGFFLGTRHTLPTDRASSKALYVASVSPFQTRP